jgi:hypothetical protein
MEAQRSKTFSFFGAAASALYIGTMVFLGFCKTTDYQDHHTNGVLASSGDERESKFLRGYSLDHHLDLRE